MLLETPSLFCWGGQSLSLLARFKWLDDHCTLTEVKQWCVHKNCHLSRACLRVDRIGPSHARLRYTSFGWHLQRWWNKTLLPRDVNLHYCRQIEVDAQTDGSEADRQTGKPTHRQAGRDGKVPCDLKTMVLGNFLSLCENMTSVRRCPTSVVR